MTMEVLRGAQTNGRFYTGGPYGVTLSPAFPGEWHRDSIELKFAVPAGKGYSDFMMRIHPESFHRLAQAMMDVAPDEAVKAFGAAMVAGCRAGDEVAFYASLADGADEAAKP